MDINCKRIINWLSINILQKEKSQRLIKYVKCWKVTISLEYINFKYLIQAFKGFKFNSFSTNALSNAIWLGCRRIFHKVDRIQSKSQAFTIIYTQAVILLECFLFIYEKIVSLYLKEKKILWLFSCKIRLWI